MAELMQLFCFDIKVNKRCYIFGADKTSICLFARFLNMGIYIDGFVSDRPEDVGIEIFHKKVKALDEVLPTESIIVVQDENIRLDGFSVLRFPFLNHALNRKNTIIYGAGSIGIWVKNQLERLGVTVRFFLDSDERKEGYIDGIPVYNKEKLKEIDSDVSVVEAGKFYREMHDYITSVRDDLECFYCSRVFDTRNDNVIDKISIDTEKNIFLSMYDNINQACELFKGKKLYMYGINQSAQKFVKFFELLDFHITGYLCDTQEIYVEDINGISTSYIEEILYEDDFLILVEKDNFFSAKHKLETLGLSYLQDFVDVRHIRSDYYLLRNNVLDVNLGYTYILQEEYPGMVILGENLETDYKIAVLGGSTTDGMLYPFKSWPEFLYEKMREKNVTIYNAGVAGYTSTQELLRLIRDIISLEPDMIIVYDGVNDCLSGAGYPFEFAYLGEIFQFANNHLDTDFRGLLKNERDFPVSKGVKTGKSSFRNWIDNIDMMHMIAEKRDIDFYAFLQPMLGNKKSRSKEEEGLWRETVMYCRDVCIKNAMQFKNLIHEEIVNGRNDYLYDLSDVFDDKDNVYLDECHVNEYGNAVLADRIWMQIKEKYNKRRSEYVKRFCC